MADDAQPRRTIVKVQLPLSGGSSALIYAEGRRDMEQRTLPRPIRKAMGQEYKAFFEAELKNGSWQIGKRVEDQPW